MSEAKKRSTRSRIGRRRMFGRLVSFYWHTAPGLGKGSEYTGGDDADLEPAMQPEGMTIDIAQHFGIAMPPSQPRRLRYRFLRLLNLEIRCET